MKIDNECFILDIGLGNLKSIENKFYKEGLNPIISSDPVKLKKSNFIIIAGVGHFKQAINNIQKNNISKILNEKMREKECKILGICLGMQLFTKFSEEGNVKGLGWFDANTIKIKSKEIKVPNINWMKLNIKKNKNLFIDNSMNTKFYFSHSYHVKCEDKNDIVSTSELKGFNFVSAIRKRNVLGVQFHIEKSYSQGMKIITNFINE